MARLKSQNVLDQNEVMLEVSFRAPLPYLLTTPNVDIKEISSYFNQIRQMLWTKLKTGKFVPFVYFLRLPRWLKW